MNQVEVKTDELIGPALDWAVAQIEGETKHVQFSALPSSQHYYAPSRKWAQGGPLIDGLDGFELKIWMQSRPGLKCEAHIHNYDGDWIAFGPTPLIAAMRCLVASKLGDTVQIPSELIQ